jgi:type IV secretory pathway TrbF-like protein
VVRWKVLVNKVKKITPYISADIHAKWWVEPNYITLPISACLLWYVLSVVKIMIEVAMVKCVLVYRVSQKKVMPFVIQICRELLVVEI